MADFNFDFIGWIIAIVTLVGIFVLLYLTWILSEKKKDNDDPVETMGHVWDEDLAELNNPLPRWWLNLFYITSFWGLGYLLFFPGPGAYTGLLDWSSKGRYEQEVAQADEKYAPLFAQYAAEDLKTLATNEDALAMGERLFATYCSTCHGSDAGGARGYPNLRDHDWLYGGEPQAIKTTILNGRMGAMPAWESILAEGQSEQVAAYVEQMSGRQVNEAQAESGKAVFMTNCAMCHGAEGEGNPMMGAPNLSDDIWLYGGSSEKILESINKGRMGVMPAHQEFLGEEKVHILAAYIYSLSQ